MNEEYWDENSILAKLPRFRSGCDRFDELWYACMWLSCSVTQSCPTPCNSIGCHLLGTSVHGIVATRILEWGAVSSSSRTFPTQELNPCLLHWRWILYWWATGKSLLGTIEDWKFMDYVDIKLSLMPFNRQIKLPKHNAVHGVAKSRTRLSDFTFTFHFHALEKEMATHSSVLAWRILGMGEPGGLPSMGSHRVRHDWSDLAVAASIMKDSLVAQTDVGSIPGLEKIPWRRK